MDAAGVSLEEYLENIFLTIPAAASLPFSDQLNGCWRRFAHAADYTHDLFVGTKVSTVLALK